MTMDRPHLYTEQVSIYYKIHCLQYEWINPSRSKEFYNLVQPKGGGKITPTRKLL